MSTINILIMDDGNVKLAVPNGRFSDARVDILTVAQTLVEADIPLVLDEIEQHAHSPEEELLHRVEQHAQHGG